MLNMNKFTMTADSQVHMCHCVWVITSLQKHKAASPPPDGTSGGGMLEMLWVILYHYLRTFLFMKHLPWVSGEDV